MLAANRYHGIMSRRTAAIAAILTASVHAEDWPAWRGPDGAGTSRGPAGPLKWSRDENVAWRTELPGPGNSTPVVWGGRIFLTQALAKENRRALMAFDAKTGKELWRQSVEWDKADPSHQTNPHCSASPVTDGKVVAAWFGAAGVAAYDLDGKRLWHRDLGTQKHVWGYGSSPVIHGGLVYLNFGPGPRSFLVALDKSTGKDVWRRDIPAGTGKAFANWNPEDMYGSWATPVIYSRGGKDELLLSLPGALVALDPASSREIWKAEGLGDLVYPSAVPAGGSILAASGFGGPTLAVKAGGERLWRKEKSKPMIGSAVVKDGHAYVVDNNGIVECTGMATGEVKWTQRLQGKGETNNSWSSPVLQGERIYVMNQGGDTFVFQASPKQFEMLGTNSLGERSNASVVPVDGGLILRTHAALWRIGR